MEGPEVVHEVRNIGRSPKNEAKDWIKVVGLIGWILVVVGVAGEGVFELATSVWDDKVKAFDEILTIDAQRRASAAESGVAAQRVLAAKLEKDAEGERLSRVKLEAFVNPRRLSIDQENDIANSLRSYAKKTVGIATYSQDAEAMILGIQIAEALDKAGISVHNRLGTFGAVGLPLYLGITVDTNSPDKKLASALYKALKNKGKLTISSADVKFGEGSTMYIPRGTGNEDAFIFVGEKPVADAQPTKEDSPKNGTKPQ